MAAHTTWLDSPNERRRDIILRAITTTFHEHATDGNNDLLVSRWFCSGTLNGFRQLHSSHVNAMVLAAFNRILLEDRQDIILTLPRFMNGEEQLQFRLWELCHLCNLLRLCAGSLPRRDWKRAW